MNSTPYAGKWPVAVRNIKHLSSMKFKQKVTVNTPSLSERAHELKNGSILEAASFAVYISFNTVNKREISDKDPKLENLVELL